MTRRDFLDRAKYLALSLPAAACELNAAREKKYYALDALVKSDKNRVTDVYIGDEYKDIYRKVQKKLQRVKRTVGYGNFNIISFDYTLKIGKYYSKVGRFTKEELDFIEYIFNYDPSIHGFYGARTCDKLTEKINKRDVKKIPRSGHYLFRGKPEKTYKHVTADIGKTLVLTSGVRSVVKQMSLFLDKLDNCNGNMSKAGKSLAPPAYSYHSRGDFDVGKKGLGYDNFTARFALTDEFRRMRKLKYIDMRYTIDNKDGVRFEPWHVKII